MISGKEIPIPRFLDNVPPTDDDRFVWQKMTRRINQYRNSQLQGRDVGASSGDRTTTAVELLGYADMKAILTQTDSRIPEFNLFRLAFKWCESKRRCFLKKHLSSADSSRMDDDERSRMVDVDPARSTGDASTCQSQTPSSFDEETWNFIDRFALQRQITAKSVLQDAEEIFKLFVLSVSDDKHKMEELDDYIAALVVYLRQHEESSESDLCEIVCSFASLRYKYVLSEFVKEIEFARLTRSQRRLALVDLEPLERRHVLQVENALYQSRILSDADIRDLSGMLTFQERWVMYYADDQCDQRRWKQLNDILQTDVVKMLVFRFLIDEREWVIAVCVPEKLVLYDTVAVNKQCKCVTQVFVSVHDENNDLCRTRLKDDYFLALDGHRLQIFVDNPKKDRTQTFVCLMDLEDSGGSVGMSVALNRFDRHSFSRDHNNAKVWRQQVSRFEIFLNQPTPMVAPAMIVGHHDDYGSSRNATSTDPPSERFRYSARAFPRLDEGPELSLSDAEEELQKIELKYYELKQKIAANQPIEDDLQDWLLALHQTSEV